MYGAGWWVIAELVLVPALLARWSWSFSTAATAPVREAALPLLAGHVVYSVILGVAWFVGTLAEATALSAMSFPGAPATPR